MDANETGRFIAALRKQKGYTQKELAEKLMVTDKAVSRWETGKGLPDTSLLKPLGDILGVSVGELLSGHMIDETQVKSQTDSIILEALYDTKGMLKSTIDIVLFIAGAALLLSPLFLASEQYYWVLGLPVIGIAAFHVYIRKRGLKLSRRVYYCAALALQGVALILELLPVGAVMVLAVGPTERIIKKYSYFDLTLTGNAHFTPILTGILTIAIIVLGMLSLFRLETSIKCKKAAFICSIIAVLFSLVPLLLFGTAGMTVVSWAVSAAMALSICLQVLATSSMGPNPPKTDPISPGCGQNPGDTPSRSRHSGV